MLALQELGVQLTELSAAQLQKIPMPEELLDAVLFAKTLSKNQARRRQLQYIGTIMRSLDPEPIRKALDDLARRRTRAAVWFQQLEKWRDGLVEGQDELIEEILIHLPGAERQRLRQLVLNARKEKELGKPLKTSRTLFRYLQELLEEKSQ